MKLCNFSRQRRFAGVVSGVFLFAFLLPLAPSLPAAGEQRFETPDAAVGALAAAVKVRDTNALHAIFAPAVHELVSPDVVEAAQESKMFTQRLEEKIELQHQSDSKIVLLLGADGWPFPIPLVKSDGRWFFDTDAGREEIFNRRVGANELGAISVVRAYVSAQREYAALDRNGDGVLEYAQRLRSAPGTRDGLYWPARPGDPLSPLGPLIAQARFEGYRRQTKIMTDEQSPYHGYYFKILDRQGRHAPGGRYDYVINGRMIAGFALVAWPAEWGNSGVMTFMVNQQGRMFQKNLGPKTSKIARAMTRYDPDDSWTPVGEKWGASPSGLPVSAGK